MTAPYYTDDAVTLYLGDCRELLPVMAATGTRFDCAVTDPPYEETGLGWDRWPTGWLDAVATVTDSMWCFLPLRQFAEPPYRGQEFRAAGWKLSHDIEPTWADQHDHVVWEKNTGSGFHADRLRRVHEPASHWYRGKWGSVHHDVPRVPHSGPHKGTVRRTVHQPEHISGGQIGTASAWVDDGMRAVRSVIRVPNLRGKAIHPTEKPVPLLDPLIRYGCPPGGTVLDPFAGSGPTGEAASMSGRCAVLIEADERYCEAIARRLAADVLPIGGAS
jgi:site-specific DNA-methyltransferase (adenine-specific)